MPKSSSGSPAKQFNKKNRDYEDEDDDDQFDSYKYNDLRDKLNELRKPRNRPSPSDRSKPSDRPRHKPEAKPETTVIPVSVSETDVKTKPKIVLTDAEVNEIVSEEESEAELEPEKVEDSKQEIVSKRSNTTEEETTPKRLKSRSRSRESVSDNDHTDQEDGNATPSSIKDTDDEQEQSNIKSGSIKKIEIRTRSVSQESKVETEIKLEDKMEILEGRIENVPEPILYYCATQGCRSVEEFECLNKIEEGAYGVVYRAKDKKTNEQVALKRLKMEKEKDGFPITSLREVDTLLKCRHPNIVCVREIVVGSNMDKIYMVMEFVEHDLKSLMQYSMNNKNFQMSEVKCLMLQLLSGIAHLHDNWIIHRDLKTSNLLLSHKGILKIADFGLAREYGSPLKEYTPIVVTLWYRSPELLLNTKKYSTAIDMWSVGCIFGELMLMKALFPGKNEKDQLDKIFKDLGTPTDKIWPGFKDLPLAQKLNFPHFPYNTLRSRFGKYLSDKGFELINKLLTYDPQRRISAEDALKHEFFKESPFPIDPSIFPTWPAKSEGLNRKKLPQDSEPKAPSAGKMYEKMVEDEGFVLQGSVAPFQLRM